MTERLAYLFEAKSIQAFIVAGGRLRDVVGGSALVDELVGEAARGPSLLDEVLAAAGLVCAGAAPEGPSDAEGRGAAAGPYRVEVLRRAAGAFSLVAAGAPAGQRLRHAADLWRLALAFRAPGLAFVDAFGEGADAPSAVSAAAAALLARRSLKAPDLPPPPPLAARVPRTGGAARGLAAETEAAEPADATLLAKKRFRDSARVLRRFSGPDARAGDWPFDLGDLFARGQERRTVAVIQADGNRLGQVLIDLIDSLRRGDGAATSPSATSGAAASRSAGGLTPAEVAYCDGLLCFSREIDSLTRAAMQAATERHVVSGRTPAGVFPARPLLQGGDDVSLIIRGDIALAWCETFLTTFEELAATRLRALLTDVGLSAEVPAMTACAGVAFVGVNQPFLQAHELADSLCRHAKSVAKAGLEARLGAAAAARAAVPSCLSFHRVTSAMIDSYDAILDRELTLHQSDGRLVLSANPYLVGPPPSAGQAPALPRLADLVALARILMDDSFSRGPGRQLMALAYEGPAVMQARYARWRDVLRRSAPALLKSFDDLHGRLNGQGRSSLATASGQVPLADAISLTQILPRPASASGIASASSSPAARQSQPEPHA